MTNTNRPNIILITTDQQRYDTLSCNGAPMVRTPALDELAADGTRFENGFINNPVCIPSRACIQTGRYTHQHGVRYMEEEIEKTPGLPVWEHTFMEQLQASGYDSGAVGKIHMKPPKGFNHTKLTNGKGARWTVPYGSPYGPSQLGDEYARWLEARHPGGFAALHAQRRQNDYLPHMTCQKSVLPAKEHLDYWTTDNALDFAAQDRDKPFFLWFGMCNPHPPIDPPAEYVDMYPMDEIPLSSRFTDCPNKPENMTEENARRFVSYYWALCSFVDDMVARLVAQLKAQGIYDNTLIIFTSDHGEMMCDFGRTGKGCFDDAVIKVPLIVKPPKDKKQLEGDGRDARPTDAGKEFVVRPSRLHTERSRQDACTTDALVELIDIAPTILDYAGLPAPERIEGESFRSMIEGNSDTSNHKQQVLCEYTSNDRSLSAKCIRTQRYKYAYWNNGRGAELYDLHNDPQEWRNMIDEPDYNQVRIEMHERLLDHLLNSQKPVFG